jgi:hypothetical protein
MADMCHLFLAPRVSHFWGPLHPVPEKSPARIQERLSLSPRLRGEHSAEIDFRELKSVG